MTTLYLAWQHPPTRRWFPVGRLVFAHQSPDVFEFAYVQGAKEADNLAGFRPIPEFPRLEQRYRASELFPDLSQPGHERKPNRPRVVSQPPWAQ